MTRVPVTGEEAVLQGEGPAVGQPEPWQRPPFEPGNQLATRHGAYSWIRLGARAEAIAARVREVVPAGSAADEGAIAGYAICCARVETAELAIAQVEERAAENPLSIFVSDSREKIESLRRDLGSWLTRKLKYEEALGLTTRSRAAIGVNVAQIEHAAGRQLLDLRRFSDDELRQLRELIARGSAPELVEGEVES